MSSISRQPRPLSPREEELLADLSVQGLDAAETTELNNLGATESDIESFELAAAAAMLAFEARGAAAYEPMPAALRVRIENDLNARFGGGSLKMPVVTRSGGASWLGWAVAAMATITAVFAWWTTPKAAPVPVAMQRQAIVESGAKVIPWSDFKHPATQAEPEIKGVSGDVAWSEAEQRGFMRIVGLKANDPTVERYQLWIIDERGIEQRVSGGLFDVASTGEVVVPFKPELKIKGAAIFAVTIEKPEGVVVSDMSRRACWAVAPPAKS
jgi:anti-sigma-K factor RskA